MLPSQFRRKKKLSEKELILCYQKLTDQKQFSYVCSYLHLTLFYLSVFYMTTKRRMSLKAIYLIFLSSWIHSTSSVKMEDGRCRKLINENFCVRGDTMTKSKEYSGKLKSRKCSLIDDI